MASIPFSAANAAYGNAARLISDNAALGAPSTGSGQRTDFAQFLAQGVQGVVDAGNRSDAMAMDMINGNANVVDVVTAIAETEMAIESMVTVRDRVISAYEEIMRMPI